MKADWRMFVKNRRRKKTPRGASRPWHRSAPVPGRSNIRKQANAGTLHCARLAEAQSS